MILLLRQFYRKCLNPIFLVGSKLNPYLQTKIFRTSFNLMHLSIKYNFLNLLFIEKKLQKSQFSKKMSLYNLYELIKIYVTFKFFNIYILNQDLALFE